MTSPSSPNSPESADPESTIATDSQPASRRIRVITSLLRRAVTLFVRSQLTAVQTLTVDLGGGDRQLLAGFIPSVSLFAEGAVYQELHLSQIQIQGQDIQINLGQVLRGKSLRLMDEIEVAASLTLEEADLNASFQSPLFDDLLCRLVHAIAAYLPAAESLAAIERQDIRTVQAQLLKDELRVQMSFTDPTLTEQSLMARTRVLLKTPRMITFRGVQFSMGSDAEPEQITIPSIPIPLGTDVEIHTLALEPRQLKCQGNIRVRP